MIISHRHRFIFFAVPRTATHSIRRALRPYLGENDWEQQMLNGRQTIPVPGIAALAHGHVGYRTLAAHLPADMLDTYFKFGFVRHPLDRFISACFFLNRGNGEFQGRETEYMKQLIRRAPFRRRVLITPQHRLLADARGRVGTDFVGRFETLQESFGEICRRIGIPADTLPRENPTLHGDGGQVMDDELRQWAVDFYREDFELFGYDPEILPVAG